MSIYKLARKMLPHVLIVKLGNRHKVKRYTLDQLLFRFTKHPKEEQILFERMPAQNVPPEMLEIHPAIPKEIALSYRRWYSKPNIQQVVRVHGKVLIEPLTGWPMGKYNALYLSLNPSGESPYMPVPNYRSICIKKPISRFDRVIQLRDVNEQGYSHFYTDIMAKLLLMKATVGDLKPYTLVVSKKLAGTVYGSYLLNNAPVFKEAGGIFLQENEFVESDESLFASVFINPTNTPWLFQHVIAEAKASASQNTTLVGHRKIFLTRGKHRKRTMQNNQEIADILHAKGFEMVDADQLTLPQQIELFTNARHVVGIHGAGLVNILYRAPHKLSLFEIREPTDTGLPLYAGYHNMTVALGFDYGATIGKSTQSTDGSFLMPADQFEKDFSRFWALYGREE